MAVEGDYIMVNKNKLIAHRHPKRTDIRYHIAQNFGGVNFWQMKPEDALDGNVLAVEHNTGCCVI